MILKFRTWDKTDKKMIHWKQMKSEFTFGYFEDENLDFMQSTGLFDKKGVEIFEGDIIKYENDEIVNDNITLKFGQYANDDTVFADKPIHIGFYIETGMGTAAFDLTDMYEEFKDSITVVGNIYENPELVQ